MWYWDTVTIYCCTHSSCYCCFTMYRIVMFQATRIIRIKGLGFNSEAVSSLQKCSYTFLISNCYKFLFLTFIFIQSCHSRATDNYFIIWLLVHGFVVQIWSLKITVVQDTQYLFINKCILRFSQICHSKLFSLIDNEAMLPGFWSKGFEFNSDGSNWPINTMLTYHYIPSSIYNVPVTLTFFIGPWNELIGGHLVPGSRVHFQHFY